ncbi:MAG: alpha-xylosidase, partial [Prolixibacteraceae bacterium]|nr:alpha-xylosidase [Prolixibacteraceae bacterium]
PMVRALFVEFPNDAGSWLVDDEYLFGSDILVAPMFEKGDARDVYLPEGKWVDYQTGEVYAGGWHNIKTGVIPVVALVRDGAVIPHIKLAQSTKDMDWTELELKVYASDATSAKGFVCLPEDQKLVEVDLGKSGNSFKLDSNPLEGKVKFKVKK